jgi:hypothetical protein
MDGLTLPMAVFWILTASCLSNVTQRELNVDHPILTVARNACLRGYGLAGFECRSAGNLKPQGVQDVTCGESGIGSMDVSKCCQQAAWNV